MSLIKFTTYYGHSPVYINSTHIETLSTHMNLDNSHTARITLSSGSYVEIHESLDVALDLLS